VSTTEVCVHFVLRIGESNEDEVVTHFWEGQCRIFLSTWRTCYWALFSGSTLEKLTSNIWGKVQSFTTSPPPFPVRLSHPGLLQDSDSSEVEGMPHNALLDAVVQEEQANRPILAFGGWGEGVRQRKQQVQRGGREQVCS
jgi:hypothetical protein